MSSAFDRIERSVFLKAPRTRVWRALSNAEEFGEWFGVSCRGKTFEVGKTVVATVTSPGFEHLTMEVMIERLEPEHLMSWRWHPAAIDPTVDYSGEPTTLVVFTLAEVEGGTRVTVVETGLDGIPVARRDQVIRLNTQGWDAQMANLKGHLDKS